MDFKIAQNRLQKLAQKNRLLIGLVGSLLVCNGVLGSLLWYGRSNQQVVLVPMGLSTKALVSRRQVSPSYLEQCALFFVNARLNITPETAEANEALVLRHTASDYRAAFKQALLNEQRLIESQKISSTFYVNSLKVKTHKLQVTVKGELKRWVGERALQTTPKTYVLSFRLVGNELRLSGFQSVPQKEL